MISLETREAQRAHAMGLMEADQAIDFDSRLRLVEAIKDLTRAVQETKNPVGLGGRRGGYIHNLTVGGFIVATRYSRHRRIVKRKD